MLTPDFRFTTMAGRMPAFRRGVRWVPLALVLVSTHAIILSALACSPGSPPIIFTSDRDGNVEVYSVDPDGSNETNLTSSTEDESSPLVSPDGRLIAFQSTGVGQSALEVMRLDGSERTAVSKGSVTHRTHRWSPKSEHIAFIAEDDQGPVSHVANTDGSRPLLLTSIPADEVGDWSGDGRSVAFAVYRGEAQGIWVRNPDGVNEFRVTETPDYSPRWSPDSRRIAFLSNRDGNPELYVMESDGTEAIRLTSTEESEYDISWSPNGKRVLFVSERDGNSEIYVAEADGSGQTRLTYNSARDEGPQWSPDGKKIAFVSYLDGDGEIFVMNSDGKDQVRLTNNDALDTDPSW